MTGTRCLHLRLSSFLKAKPFYGMLVYVCVWESEFPSERCKWKARFAELSGRVKRINVAGKSSLFHPFTEI